MTLRLASDILWILMNVGNVIGLWTGAKPFLGSLANFWPFRFRRKVKICTWFLLFNVWVCCAAFLKIFISVNHDPRSRFVVLSRKTCENNNLSGILFLDHFHRKNPAVFLVVFISPPRFLPKRKSQIPNLHAGLLTFRTRTPPLKCHISAILRRTALLIRIYINVLAATASTKALKLAQCFCKDKSSELSVLPKY